MQETFAISLLKFEKVFPLPYFNSKILTNSNFREGVIFGGKCSYAHLDGLEEEVNFISCLNLNTKYLMNTCDINTVAALVNVKVKNKKVVSADWTVGTQF